MDPKEWLPKWTTRSDLAAAAVGYATGFAVDIFYFPAGVFAIGTVGLKNSVQTAIEAYREKRREQQNHRALEERATVLYQTLTEEELEEPAGKLARDLHLWRKGILEDDDLQTILDEVIRDYRKRRLGEPAPLSPVASGRCKTLEVDEEMG